jgi:hypothetical protein
MNRATLSSLILSITVLTVSTIGSAFLVQKLAAGNSGFDFLCFGCLASAIIFLPQALTFPKAQKRLFFQLVYFGFLGFSMAWFLLALFFPVFWIVEIGQVGKLFLFAIFLTVTGFNLALGWRMFNKNWGKVGISVFKTEFKGDARGGDWNEVMKRIKVHHYIAVPGISRKCASAVSIALVVFMVVGLNLRTMYPVFSVFAWGIPAVVMASYFVQVSGSYFAQANQVKKLEADLGNVLNSTS